MDLASNDRTALRIAVAPGHAVTFDRKDIQKLARIRNAVSESQNESPMAQSPTAHEGSVDAINERSDVLSTALSNAPSTMTTQRQLSSSRRLQSAHHNSMMGSQLTNRSGSMTASQMLSNRALSRTASRRALEQTGRTSMAQYAQQLSRMQSAHSAGKPMRLISGEGFQYATSVVSLANIEPEDFQRPMYRQDIFYAGSVSNLPTFKGSNMNISQFRQSMLSIPTTMIDYDEIGQLPAPANERSIKCFGVVPIPASVVNVISEMADLSLLRNPLMLILCLANVISMAGFYAPYLFIPPRAIDLGVSPADAASLLSVVGLSNTIGRVFYGWFADLQLVSALRLSNFSIIGCGILNILFLVCTNYYTMVAYGLAFGFIIAGIMSLTSIVLCDLVGLSRLTNAYGLLCLFRGIAFIFGSPLAGIVYDWTASYNMTFVYSAVLFLLSGGMTLFIEVLLKYKPDTCLANQPALQPLLASPAAGMANAYNANNRKLTAVRENEEDYQEEDEDDLDDDEEGGYGPGGARSVSMSKLPPLFEEHSHYGHGREHAHKEPEGGVLEALIEEEDSQLTEQSNSVLGKRFRLLAEGGQSIHSQQKSEIEPLKKIMERMDAEKPANPTE